MVKENMNNFEKINFSYGKLNAANERK